MSRTPQYRGSAFSLFRIDLRSALIPVFSRAGGALIGYGAHPVRLLQVKPGDERRVRRLRILALIALVLAVVVGLELRSSILQSLLLSRLAPKATFTIGQGPSGSIVFPSPDAPYDSRLGYAGIPGFVARLEANGFRVEEQARFSPSLLRLARWGVSPPYQETDSAGLVLHSATGEAIFDARPDGAVLHSFEEIPPLVTKSLLFIENRELDTQASRKNPVVEWDRLARAGISYVASKVGLPMHVQGGSALATQIEKYRHSPEGRTGSAGEKLRQMAAASLKVYRDGPYTQVGRQRIVLDYLNSIPLAAAPGYGEVHGLGAGLQAWFGLSLPEVLQDLRSDGPPAERARAFKHVLALLCAVRAPTDYLVHDPQLLEKRADYFASRLAEAGVIDPVFAMLVRDTRLGTPGGHPPSPASRRVANKAVDAERVHLQHMLGLPSLYELDRLHLTVETTLDFSLQEETEKLLRQLGDPEFIEEHGLRGERLLSSGDPADVLYSVLLFERTPLGNEIRVQADNLDQPLDLNEGMKLELGSTAKLRTVTHYLEIMEGLHAELSGAGDRALAARAAEAHDPLTAWAVETMRQNPGTGLEDFLQASLDRTYSASPGETFFTGGGLHNFANFDPKDNSRRPTVREALVQSINLVYIRLMRDVVRYHEANLPYDADQVLSNPADPVRKQMLAEIADDEARQALSSAYRGYRGLTLQQSIEKMLGRRAASPRHLAILFYAWNPGGDEEALSHWMIGRGVEPSRDELSHLVRAYSNPSLTISDYGWLLGVHPLEVWCAGRLVRNPDLTWSDLVAQSEGARQEASAWLFKTRNRHAQDLRLRIRFERDAFDRMTPSWKRLGFPFDRLVPSYATAIGSSCDRPAALAELMGILLNDGVLLPARGIRELRFAEDTPYHTVLETEPPEGEHVLSPEIARTVRGVLSKVVEQGTARRAAGSIALPDSSKAVIGGKTGSGDNRFVTFARGGRMISSRAVNRTATFVFYVQDRYFGVITAFVPGHEAEDYSFTSALPVSVFKLLAPALERRFSPPSPPAILDDFPPALVLLPRGSAGDLTTNALALGY